MTFLFNRYLKMNQKNHVEKLLRRSKEYINKFELEQSIDEIDLKEILGHLKSSLEYIAQDIYKKINNGDKSVYFPYGQTKEDFLNSIKKNKFENLLQKEFSDIYNLLKKLQPFECNSNWLTTLSKLTNLTKHNSLVEVKRQNIHGGYAISNFFSIAPDNCENIIVRNCIVDGMPTGVMKFDGNNLSIIKSPHPDLPIYKLEKTILYLDDGSNLKVIPFLKECYLNIFNFFKQIYIFI